MPTLLADLRVPGAALALIEDGVVVWTGVYGVTDARTTEPVTPLTSFNVGSISKTVTAWGVMRLVEEGKLGLDRPVMTHLRRWQFPPSGFDPAGVTVERLLSHTAGLNVPYNEGFAPGEVLPMLEASLAGHGRPPVGVEIVVAPGTKYMYSGGGYSVLQLLVEEVTGQGFSPWMTASVLVPLGMSRSRFGMALEDEAASAVAHDDVGRPMTSERYTDVAAGGLQTTIGDLAILAAAGLAAPGARPGRNVLQPASVTRMMELRPPAPNYGLGYQIGHYGGHTVVGHGGTNPGWAARFLLHPSERQGIAVVTNGTNGNPLNDFLACTWREHVGAVVEGDRCSLPVDAIIGPVAVEHGGDAAIARYRELRVAARSEHVFEARVLNEVGYRLMRIGRIADAVAIFQRNAHEYPNDANVHDSLGEALLAAGDREGAMQSYCRALELDPVNARAAEVCGGHP